MTKHEQKDPENGIEQKLTAYLMGEADAATVAEVETALEADPQLRQRRAEMERTLSLLRSSDASGEGALDASRREALRQAASGKVLQGPGSRLARMRPWMSVAAVLLVTTGVVYWKQPADQQPVAVEARLEQLSGLGYTESEAPSSRYSGGGTASAGEAKRKGRGASDGTMDSPFDSSLGSRLEVTTPPPPSRTPAVPSTPTSPSTPGTPSTPSAPPAEGAHSAPTTSLGLVTHSAPEPVEETMELEVLGYVGSDDAWNLDAGEALELEDLDGSVADFLQPNVRGREENLMSDGRRLRRPEPRCIVIDGYGRRYHDVHVVEHLRPLVDERPQDMFFRYYGDNPEVITRVESMSTFAADVDTASYPLARNYLVDGNLPPKAAIRTEEFVNYFDYGLEAPKEDDFTVHLTAAPSPFAAEGSALLSIGIQAREVEAEARPPMNLVFVIDKSGSMDGERMELVKRSLELLIDQIREDDSLGIVAFDSRAHLVLEPTPARERWKLREAVRNLTTGGSTNAGEGLAMGYKLIEQRFDPDHINRVVLASDGVANTGETDQVRILKQVQAQAEAEVDLTALGVGMGNHNDVFLEQLANQGDGSCHYIDDFEEAKRVLVDQFLGTLVTIARDVKIQVEFDDAQVQRWRQLGYENRSLRHEDFRNDSVDAGEVGSGHTVTALYELSGLQGDAEGPLVTVRLRWFPDGANQAVEREYSLAASAITSRWGLAPSHLRLAGVAGQYAEVLRRSHHARNDSYSTLLEEAKKLAQESSDPEVAELRDMIRRTADLVRWSPPSDEISLLVESLRSARLREAELRLLGEGDERVQDLLVQVRLQNEELEAQLQQLLRD